MQASAQARLLPPAPPENADSGITYTEEGGPGWTRYEPVKATEAPTETALKIAEQANPAAEAAETKATIDRTHLPDAAISVLLAVFNQENSVETAVTAWRDFLETLGRDYEILLVDDCSTDQSLARAEALVSTTPRLRVFHHTSRTGYGGAMRTALAQARFPLFAFTTCDAGYHAQELAKFIQWMNRVDLVTGYRVTGEGTYPRTWAGRGYWLLNRVFFAVRLRDLPCLFGLASRDIFARIPIQANSDFAVAEVIAKANFLGHVMTELPIRFESPTEPWTDPQTPWDVFAEMRQVFARPQFGSAQSANNHEVGTATDVQTAK